MQRICIDNHNRIFYYSNPAGYIAEKEAVVDTMFQTQELESFLQKAGSHHPLGGRRL